MINHNKKCIFFRIPKTGTTSIYKTLVKYGFNKKHISVAHISPRNFPTSNYFSFAFTRNPFDRLISLWQYHNSRLDGRYVKRKPFVSEYIKTDRSFREYLRCSGYMDNSFVLRDDDLESNTDLISQYDWLCDSDGKLLVDFIGKYENIQKDFDIVMSKCGMPTSLLPHTNKTVHGHYSTYYDDELISIVSNRYKKDLDYFGYKFEQI